MKRLLMLMIMLFAIIIPTAVHAETLKLQYDGGVHDYNDEQYTLIVKDRTLQVPLPPILFNDRALVPIREVFEALGATVDYDSATQGITVQSSDVTVKLQINSNDAYVNGKKVNIPDGVVPKLIGRVGESAKTMVPVRFISESIGLNVEFDGNNGAIRIASSPAPAPAVNPNIKSVEFVDKDWGVVITVEADKSLSDYQVFTMTDPFKIVLDIKNASVANVSSTYNYGKKYIERVRLGQHEASSRIVVDMKEKRDFYITTDGNYLWINITTNAEPSAQQPNTNVPNNGKLVVLDAGHGGDDGGTHGVTSDGTTYYEKDVALQIELYVKEILQQNGINVLATKESDVFIELADRAGIANANNAALFVSIHLNSSETAAASGTEVLYTASNNGDSYGITSQQLATNIDKELIAAIGTRNRGVKQQNLSVCRNSVMPAALVEVGFMSNTAEMDNLANPDFQYKAAQGIARGIMKSLESVTMPQQPRGIEYMTD